MLPFAPEPRHAGEESGRGCGLSPSANKISARRSGVLQNATIPRSQLPSREKRLQWRSGERHSVTPQRMVFPGVFQIPRIIPAIDFVIIFLTKGILWEVRNP